MKKLLAGTLIAFATISPLWAQRPAGPGEDTVARTIKVGDLSRTFYLHVPPKLPRDKAVPLVLMFHGGGGTPAFAEGESKFSELADREGFLVAYPEGIGKSWNDGRNNLTIVAQRDNIDDLGFVAALIDDVAKEHKVDAKRVFSTGISNGAIFSHHLAANLSSRIAAIAPVVGGLAETSRDKFQPEKPVAVLILQGTDDPLVPYNGGDIALPGGAKRAGIVATDETVKKWVEHNGCQREAVQEELADKAPNDGCRVKKFTYAKGKDGTEVVLFRIEGGGHTWPNGVQYLPERLIGKVCRDINGTEVIWEFFKAHPKP
ncbi:MAG TPA: PHB depolymerase family esterase [Planctomycetaceae bacterium]|nr:PHB depolymerase family esterase [Planctomycetaceae bacterium]